MSIGPAAAEKMAETVSSMKWFKEIRFGEVLLLIVLVAIGYGAWFGIPKYIADERADRKAASESCEKEKTSARDDFVKSLSSQQALFKETLDRFEGRNLKAAGAAAATAAKAAREDGPG